MYKIFRMMFLAGLLCFAPLMVEAQESDIPVAGKVTMVDLGSKNCIPCKMMAPVLENLEKFYADKAAILFVDVKENPSQGSKYGIRTIPTQIFYDRQGKERGRHEGYMEESAIKEKIDALLAE